MKKLSKKAEKALVEGFAILLKEEGYKFNCIVEYDGIFNKEDVFEMPEMFLGTRRVKIYITREHVLVRNTFLFINYKFFILT